MNREYTSDKEYSLLDVLKYNLRKWWMAALLAAIFAVIIGGYKGITLKQYVDNKVYQDQQRVVASVLVQEYSSAGVIERGTNIIKIANSNKVYKAFCEITGYNLTLDEFQNMFKGEQTEASDMVTFYALFPYTCDNFTLNDEEQAITFMSGLINAVDRVTYQVFGRQCITVIDEPVATKQVEKMDSYSISQSDYKRAVLKAITAGILLGIIIEVVCYTLWLMIYKKPKDANEVQECLEAPVIDVIPKENEDVEVYKRVAMFLAEAEGHHKINCIMAGNKHGNTALKVAMCYANEQKKTLYLDLNDSTESEESMSKYIIGKEEQVQVQKMNDYLDALHRTVEDEEGYDLVRNQKFKQLMDDFGTKYEYIVVNGRDIGKFSESYGVSTLCDKTFVVCDRKNVKTELLYSIRNTAVNNDIRIDGVLVYDV